MRKLGPMSATKGVDQYELLLAKTRIHCLTAQLSKEMTEVFLIGRDKGLTARETAIAVGLILANFSRLIMPPEDVSEMFELLGGKRGNEK